MITKIKTEKKKKAKKPRRKMYANRIKAILNEIGMSQQELADMVETDSAHLSKIIHGKKQCLSLPTAIKIAQALSRPVEEVFVLKAEKSKEKK